MAMERNGEEEASLQYDARIKDFFEEKVRRRRE